MVFMAETLMKGKLKLRLYWVTTLLLCIGYLDVEQVVAEEVAKISLEIVVHRDASGNAYLPHGEPFEVRISNTSEVPILIWDDLCEPGHWALSFLVKGAHGENLSVEKRSLGGFQITG